LRWAPDAADGGAGGAVFPGARSGTGEKRKKKKKKKRTVENPMKNGQHSPRGLLRYLFLFIGIDHRA